MSSSLCRSAEPDADAAPLVSEEGPSAALVAVLAFASAAIVGNLYYVQPLVSRIAPELGLSPDLAGALVSVTQVGYALGLFLLVSLADLVENRTLVLTMIGFTTLGLLAAAFSTTALPFFLAMGVTGMCSTGAQVLLPFTAHLVPEARRGRTVGNVMAGLLAGIMLSRPVALFIAAHFGWRSVFFFSAALMVVIGLCLGRMMPRYKPRGGQHYGQIITSMLGLMRSMPVLQRRTAYQSLMFTGFTLFWTAGPIMLADTFHLDQQGIAFFALAGAGGALAAPVAGRLADRGYVRAATGAAALALCVSFILTGWVVGALSLAGLVVLALVIDAAAQTNQVVGQRTIFGVAPHLRGRVNAVYMTVNFFVGALGSVLATVLYHHGGWTAVAWAGGVVGLVMLALFATEFRRG